MSNREFIALGTSSQVPTRERSHNAYLLRWDGEGFLLDPGEGTQRQLALAGVPASSIHHICISHFHGDHCLGLPGILQRLSLDGCDHTVCIYYPESGQPYLEHLCGAAIYQKDVELSFRPVEHSSEGMISLRQNDAYVLNAHILDHTVPTIGFRLEEREGRRFVPEQLERAEVRGPDIGELRQKGQISIGDRIVRLNDVSVPRPGSAFAFVMDTGPCSGAVALATDADLLVMESTYTSEYEDLARLYRHSTAADAARTAQAAGAHQLALTHFSQRYRDVESHVQEAQAIFANVSALNDLDRIVIPRRPAAPEP